MAKVRSSDTQWLPSSTPAAAFVEQLESWRPIVSSTQAVNTAKTYLDIHKQREHQVHLQYQRHQQLLQKDTAHHTQLQHQPMLIKLVNAKDVLPYVLMYLDTRSLLALSCVNTKIRRDILMPPVPALNTLTLFLETCTVSCPMALFESLKDFISKYRSFRPAHLHFTYSAQFNLSSITPMEPIYNSKNDASLAYPSGSPLASTNSQIGIHVHRPLASETAHENDQPDPQHLIPESSRTASTESVRSCSSFCNDLLSTKDSASTCTSTCASTPHMTPSPSTSVADANSYSTEINSISTDIGENANRASIMASSSAATSLLSNMNIPSLNSPVLSQQPSLSSQEKQRRATTPTACNGIGSIHVDVSNMLTPEAIPVHASSSAPRFKGHGFELSYWQKFALNELFLRSLPFLRTLTIGRIDKPKRFPMDEETERTSMELAAGVCYFLARCFNVMHDMPDTALESVIWMDVTSREVVLLAAMIELRDIVVDDRYWRRGYWTWSSPVALVEAPVPPHDDDPNRQQQEAEQEEDTRWEGFYYLLYQDEKDDKPLARRILPPIASSSTSVSVLGSASTLNGGCNDRRLSSPPATPAILGMMDDWTRIENSAHSFERGSAVSMERNHSLIRAGSSPDTRAIARIAEATVSMGLIASSSSQSTESSWMPSSTGGGVDSSSMHELSQPYGEPSASLLQRQSQTESGATASIPIFPDAETDLAVQVYQELRRRVAENASFPSSSSVWRIAIDSSNGGHSSSTLCRDEQTFDRKGKAPALQDNFTRLSIHS